METKPEEAAGGDKEVPKVEEEARPTEDGLAPYATIVQKGGQEFEKASIDVGGDKNEGVAENPKPKTGEGEEATVAAEKPDASEAAVGPEKTDPVSEKKDASSEDVKTTESTASAAGGEPTEEAVVKPEKTDSVSEKKEASSEDVRTTESTANAAEREPTEESAADE